MRRLSDRALIFGFTAPSLVIMLGMVAFPIASLVYNSFYRFSYLRPAQPREYVGLENYSFLLTDPALWERFIFTGKFVVFSVGLQFALGIAVAYVLQRSFRGRDVLFTALMMPMMLSPIVVGFLWRYIFNSQWGVMNFLLDAVRIGEVEWLNVGQNALWAVVIADTWMWTPFVVLLATAAFRGVPRALHEAAAVDGASPAYRFFRITLPLSLPILSIAFILRLIDSFKQYDLFFAMTGGGPGNATHTVSFTLAKTAFSYFYTGEASALAVIMLIMIIGLSLIFVRFLTQAARRM